MMMISIIIIVPPALAIGRGKMLTAISTMFILLARRRQLASAHVCRCSLKVLRGDPNLNWTSL